MFIANTKQCQGLITFTTIISKSTLILIKEAFVSTYKLCMFVSL